MLFNSVPFLFVFLPVTYLGFWTLRTKRQRHLWLAVTGYVFYAFWNWRFCGLMLLSTAVSFGAGLGLEKSRSPAVKRALLWGSVAIDLGLLAFFKYTNMALEAASAVLDLAGSRVAFPSLDIVLPVGISFYTLHTVTYVVDCSRGRIRPTADIAEYACYVSFFAQLVAGPIVRFGQIEGDLSRVGATPRRDNLDAAWRFFALGLMKKVLLADSLATLVDPLLAAPQALNAATAWLCLLGYGYQLYFDFSGYSDMAVGLGLLFGLRLPQNFATPYRAVDPGDFWRRWHISLSTVLRDYLFNPLGGALASTARGCRNFVVTMLLGGLWHGASVTFVLWGGYHGLLLAAQLAFLPPRRRPAHPRLQTVVTFLLVTLAWVLFRSSDLSMAAAWYRALVLVPAGPLPPQTGALVAFVVLSGALAHLGPNTFQLDDRVTTRRTLALAVGFLLAVVVVLSGAVSPFLYFQF